MSDRQHSAKRSWRFKVALAVLLVLSAACLADAVGDHAQLHSFFPPILQHYWQNGFLFWSFGKQTVVTDSYVRLTSNEPGSKGYLWNRHDNQMGSFRFDVTARMANRDGSWFSSGNADNGLGIWYAVKSSKPLDDTSFYGFEKAFDGFGVVLDHSNQLTLYAGDGASSSFPRKVAACAVSALKENFITISIVYDAQQLITVSYTKHKDAQLLDANVQNNKDTTTCVTAHMDKFDANSRRHFGVTASNSESEQTAHDIHSIFMTPLSDVEAHEMEEERVRNVRIFADEEEGGGHHTLNAEGTETQGDAPSAPPRRRSKKNKKKRSPQ